MKIIYILIFLLFVNQVFAYEFSGTITDAESNQSLIGATIKVENTGFGAYADKNGNFHISRIPIGSYKIIISMVGYEISTLKLDFPKDDKKNINITLTEQSLRTSEIIVSANKRVQTVQEVPVSVSTIELKSLKDRNITDIDRALEYIPGVNLNGDQVSIRGSSGFAFGVGSRVAYLLDGFSLLSGDQGDMKFDIIPIFNIERIEVVKGAGSALYGTGALGGVINIITENPNEQGKLQLNGYSGIYTKPKYEQWVYDDDYAMNKGVEASYSKKINKTGFLISARILEDDSYRKFDDRVNWNIFAKINKEISDVDDITGLFFHSDNDHADWVYWRNLDSATIPPEATDLKTRTFSKKSAFTLNYRHIFESGDFIILKSGMFLTSFENNISATDADFRSSNAYTLNNELQFNYKIIDGFFLTSGINNVYNDVDANIYGQNKQITTALYSQLEMSMIDNCTVTAGLRADHEKSSGSHENLEFSPKIGIAYHFLADYNIRASFGKGFRTATLAEKYATINYGPFKVRPNNDIDPESSLSYEFGVNKEYDFFNSIFVIDFSIFENDMKNMIEAQFVDINTQPFIQFKNVTKAYVRGAEVDIKTFLFGAFGFQTSLTYMDAHDITLNETLKYRSKILWYSGLIIPYEFIEFQADYRFISKPEKVDDLLNLFIKNASERVNTHVVDMRMIFHLKKLTEYDINLIINTNNLFDYYYTLYPGNLAPTRSVTLQLNAVF